jgi:hypothetical protein
MRWSDGDPDTMTWIRGLLAHLILVPLWTLSPAAIAPAFALLFFGWYLCGLALLAVFAGILLVRFPYSPALARLIYYLDMTGFYRRCALRGHLSSLTNERNLFMYHPHGILCAGFVVNGCWSRAFNQLTAKKDLDPRTPSGTVFLIASVLRNWAPLFKLFCDVSGRLESADKGTLQRLMRDGRNIAIIPGGMEDASLHQFGKERTMLKPRKGLIK